MPTDSPQTEPCFYTPSKIVEILKALPYFPDRQVTDSPETDPSIRNKKLYGVWPLENSVIVKADVERELQALPHFTRQIVYRAYVHGDSDSHLATVLRCDRETVKRHRIDGVELMASRLGWQGPRRAEQRRRRPETVYRNPRLESGGAT